jgi:hypothetical protein
MKIKDNLKIVLLWIFLNICVIILLQLQTYMESRPGMKEEFLINKIKNRNDIYDYRTDHINFVYIIIYKSDFCR